MSIWLTAIALSAAPAAVAVEDAILVPSEKLEGRRIAGADRIRTPWDEAPDGRLVALDVTIDESGAVIGVARPFEPLAAGETEEDRDTRWSDIAAIAVRQWRFRPLLFDGRLRRARGRVSIAVVPREREIRRRADFPAVRREEVTISMTRGGCDNGACPAYSVTVSGDGRVRFFGQDGVLVRGAHDSTIPAAQVEQLIERFRAADFWSLDLSYRSRVANQPVTALTFSAGGASWTLIDQGGIAEGLPDSVVAIETAIDEAADTARWVGGNERTIAALEAEHYDFRADAAFWVLVSLIGRVPEDQIVSLIDRGVPLDPPQPCSSCMFALNESLFGAAMARGSPALLDRLLATPEGRALTGSSLNRLLIEAARLNSPVLVERLLALGADPAYSDYWMGTAVLAAAVRGDWNAAADADQAAVVRLLLARGAPVNARTDIGRTALQYAHESDPAIVRMLIRAGADVNAATPADPRRRRAAAPPLLYLTQDEAVALAALEAGANRNLRNAAGETLARIARRLGWTRVQALIRR